MSSDAAIDDWDEIFLGEALHFCDLIEASRNPTQNPNSTNPNPNPNPQPLALLLPPPIVAGGGRGGDGDGVSAVEYSPPREFSQRVSERIESSVVCHGSSSQAMRAPLVAKNGGYGGRGGGGAGGGKKRRDRESERLKSELERISKELRTKECECKELQKDRDEKDEQLKVANLHIENKDAEICRLKSTNLTCLRQAKDVQTDGQCAVPELKNQIRIENGLTNTSGIAVQENCFPKGTSQSKRSRTMGVQTDTGQDSGLSDAKNILSLEHDISSKLRSIWGSPGDKMLGRNLISKLFATCAEDFCVLFKCMGFPLNSNLESLPRNISGTILPEGMQCPQLAEAVKVSRLYEIFMKVRHEVAPLQILLEALFDLCTLENVVAAHKSLCILRAILQHLSCRTKLDKRNNVLVDRSQCNSFPEGRRIGLGIQSTSDTSTLRSFDLENEDRISTTSMYLSFDASNLIFEKMQQIAISKMEEYIQTEALSVMNLMLMACNPSEREKFRLVQLLESLPQLLRKEIALCVRKQAVRLLFLLLNCPKMLLKFCDWQRDDRAETADHLVATPTFRERINCILEGLAECLACAGPTTQELKLQRDVIVVLAFIASSGKSGFDVLLYSATPQRVNFLELIVRVLSFEMDLGKDDIAKSQIVSKERISLLREALILLNRLASSPAYSRVTLAVLTSNATARLTIDMANRMSGKSRSQWKHDGTKKLQVEDEIVDLARLFKARVSTFLGENNP